MAVFSVGAKVKVLFYKEEGWGGVSLYCAAPSMQNKGRVYAGSCVQRRERAFPNGKLNHGAGSALWTTSVNFSSSS